MSKKRRQRHAPIGFLRIASNVCQFGRGYPSLTYPRDCHHGSKLVHVCDVYDALRTNRPYRDAWLAEKVLSYLDEGAGTEFDGEVARQFVRMMRERESRVATLAEDETVPTG